MQKYIKTVLGVLILVIIVGLFVIVVPDENGEYIWNPFDYARVTEVDYKAVVVYEPGSNGKVIITERLTFDIYAFSESNPFWELWRALPEEYIDGVKVEYKVNSVKQIFDDGREPVVFTESPKLYWYDDDYINTEKGFGPGKWYHSEGPYDENERRYECVFMYVDGLYRETVVFEIEYEMYNASLRYNDSSELYISLYDDSSIKYIKSFKGQILFPNDKMPRSGNYYANTYGTNAHSFPFTESGNINPGYYTFAFELNESQLKFKPYNQYIEFALVSYGEDKHIFTQYASKNIYYNDYYNSDLLEKLKREQSNYEALPKTFRTAKIIVFLILSAVAGLIILLALRTNKKIKERHAYYEPAMYMDYFRDIPSELDPNFAAELVFCKHKSSRDIPDGYAAVMLSLVRKGYIELEEEDRKFKNAKIIVKYRPVQAQPEVYSEEKESTEYIYRDGETIVHHSVLENDATVENIVQPQQAQNQIETNTEPLTPTEELYFNLILRHARETDISMAEFQTKISEDYQNTYSFVKNVKNAITIIGVSQGYFQEAEYKKPRKQLRNKALLFVILAVLIMTLGNIISYQTRLDLAFGGFFILSMGFIISAVYLIILSKKCVLLTQFGEDEYAKWRGLYNFLNSETLINERTVIELVTWEQYLIYATAFGISEKVIKALKIRCAETNFNTSPVLRNRYFWSSTFYFRSRSFTTATRTASYTARSGGHGGYGGGGRGGGGGGGGH